ncbi:MAG: potassium channel family protein, partial [Planctomycetota bacterium]|nr:potassium channel family protein [Planctomycetota bacterium]
PNIESRCLARLKDVDLFTPEPDANHERRGWFKSAWQVSVVFFVGLFGSAFAGGLVGSHFHWHVMWQGVVSLVVLVALVVAVASLISKCEPQRRGRPFRWDDWLHEWAMKLGNAVYYYGERVFHAVVAWGVVIVMFALMYCVFGNMPDSWLWGAPSRFDLLRTCAQSPVFSHGWSSFWRSLPNCIYFSTVTFATLGYGDLVPLGLAKLFAALETCLGAVMIALFVLSFARRTAAR